MQEISRRKAQDMLRELRYNPCGTCGGNWGSDCVACKGSGVIPTGKIFSVRFIRRKSKPGEGPDRLMVCRFSERVARPGVYDPEAYNLLWVWDMQENAPRSVNMDTILELHMNGVKYKVTTR